MTEKPVHLLRSMSGGTLTAACGATFEGRSGPAPVTAWSADITCTQPGCAPRPRPEPT